MTKAEYDKNLADFEKAISKGDGMMWFVLWSMPATPLLFLLIEWWPTLRLSC